MAASNRDPSVWQWLLFLVLLWISPVMADDTEPLSFEFIKHPPGELIFVDTHRVHVNCQGEGDITVLLESGLGGGSLEWLPVQKALGARARVCAYDRAGYAWSDPSPKPRHALQIAKEAQTMLRQLNIDGPLILVGHSFGGLVIRMLANVSKLNIIGMVLIESSHEDQFNQMESAGVKSVMPTGRSFVISYSEVPENLPDNIKKQVLALSRMRKSYAATHAEMAEFRHSARQVKIYRKKLDYPVAVLIRGQDPFNDSDNASTAKNDVWQSLQQDLVRLSDKGYAKVAQKSGHHVHVDEPELVAETIEALIDGYKNH